MNIKSENIRKLHNYIIKAMQGGQLTLEELDCAVKDVKEVFNKNATIKGFPNMKNPLDDFE